MKTILKNIIITILLIVVVCLILALIFYSDSPFSKEVPLGAGAYATDKSISDALEKPIDTENIINDPQTLGSADLTRYNQSFLFRSGKANPFGNMEIQSYIDMPEEYMSSGGLFRDNTLNEHVSGSSTNGTGASSSSSSAGRVIEDTNTSTSQSTSTNSFYKSTGGLK